METESKVFDLDKGDDFGAVEIPLRMPFKLKGVVYSSLRMRVPTGAEVVAASEATDRGSSTDWFESLAENLCDLPPGALRKIFAGAAIIQEAKGQTAGFMHRSFMSSVRDSRISGRAARLFSELGLIEGGMKFNEFGYLAEGSKLPPDYSKYVELSNKGQLTHIKPGAIKGAQLAVENPDRWLREIVEPAFEKAGMSEVERRNAITQMFQNSNAASLASILREQRSKIEKDSELMRNAPGLRSSETWQKEDPRMAWGAVHSQFWNFLRGTMEPFMPASANAGNATAGVLGMINKINDVNPWVNPSIMASALGAGGWLAMQAAALKNMPKVAAAATMVGRGLGLAGRVLGPIATVGQLAYGAYQSSQGNWDRVDDPEADRQERRNRWRNRGRVDWPSDQAAPQVDTSSIDTAKNEANAAGGEIAAALNVKTKPEVDTSSLSEALGLARSLRQELAGIGSTIAAIGRAGMAGRSQGALHDGPEVAR